MTLEAILIMLSLIDKAAKYGVPAVTNVVKSLGIAEPSLKDIIALEITKKPEDYFDE